MSTPFTRTLKGRKTLYYSRDVNTEEDVKKALSAVYLTHKSNISDIEYLWNYFLGKQDVLNREKQFRSNIQKNTVVNHANQFVTFFSAYTFGEGAQLIQTGTNISDEENKEGAIGSLNKGLAFKDKRADDLELATYMLATGVAYRSILPATEDVEDGELPIKMGVLNPLRTGIIYSTDINPEPILAFTYVKENTPDAVDSYVYLVYTKTHWYKFQTAVKDGNFQFIKTIATGESKLDGNIPIIEYNPNAQKQGVFETVIPILNMINEVTSNRGEAVEQFVQSYWKFVNTDITLEEYLKFMESGAILLKSGRDDKYPSDVDLINQELDQSGVQAFVDDLTLRALQIAGVPDRRNSTNGSTGAANMTSNGWYDSDSKVDAIEGLFIKSEKRFLKILLNLSRRLSSYFEKELSGINLSDIEIKFTRNKTANFLVKAQGLKNLIETGIHPRYAIAASGLWSDVEGVYQASKDRIEQIYNSAN